MIVLNSPLKPNLKKLTTLLEKINSNGWYTNFGPIHAELTDRLEDYLGVENLLLTNNGTSALQVAGRALNSKSILTTPFSFVATVSAFGWQGDSLNFSDINPSSLNLDAGKIVNARAQGCDADTIVGTHVYGNPCDVEEISRISKHKNLKVIYDAAHAFGIKVKSKSVLSWGDASTLSFHATKIFHTVEGGAVIFKDRDVYQRAKKLINFGLHPDAGIVETGVNAKMNEYQAAVGLVNLEEMDNILDHRATLFNEYFVGLESSVQLPVWHKDSNVNGAYMPILLQNEQELNKLVSELNFNDIQSRRYFTPSLDQVFSGAKNYGSSLSRDVSNRVLCLPLHSHMSINEVKKIVEITKKVV